MLGAEELDELFKEETWPKKCGCGNVHTEEGWECLRYIGVQKSGMKDIPDLEMRSCGCGATMAIVVPRDFIDP